MWQTRKYWLLTFDWQPPEPIVFSGRRSQPMRLIGGGAKTRAHRVRIDEANSFFSGVGRSEDHLRTCLPLQRTAVEVTTIKSILKVRKINAVTSNVPCNSGSVSPVKLCLLSFTMLLHTCCHAFTVNLLSLQSLAELAEHVRRLFNVKTRRFHLFSLLPRKCC